MIEMELDQASRRHDRQRAGRPGRGTSLDQLNRVRVLYPLYERASSTIPKARAC